MALAPLDFLSRIKPLDPRTGGGFDALSINASRCRMFVPTCLLADSCPQRVMDSLPNSRSAPSVKVTIYRFPRWKVFFRQHSPRTTRPCHVKHRIKQSAHAHFARPPDVLLRWNQIFHCIPLLVAQICRVARSFLAIPPGSLLGHRKAMNQTLCKRSSVGRNDVLSDFQNTFSGGSQGCYCGEANICLTCLLRCAIVLHI